MINGFIVVNKPAGITSHDVVSRVRRILSTRKVGHTGTLDPFATGVLPVAVNDGTKTIPFLNEGIKSYDAVIQLGVVTDTLDMTGMVLKESSWLTVTKEKVESVLNQFIGQVSQIPPMYSAIKLEGQPLYKLARRGQTVERTARVIHIYSLELLSFDPPFVKIRVVCSRGTYVRTLSDDIGRILGCGGALKELLRTNSGPFNISSSVSLEDLEASFEHGALESLLVSPYSALSHLPDIPLNIIGVSKVKHGQPPDFLDAEMLVPTTHDDGTLVRLTYNGALIAVAECNYQGCGEPRIVLKRVFM